MVDWNRRAFELRIQPARVAPAGYAVQASGALVAAVAEGELTPSEAGELGKLIEAYVNNSSLVRSQHISSPKPRACSSFARARRYTFYFDEVAEAEAQGLPYVLVPRELSKREWMERYAGQPQHGRGEREKK
jgi:hypothetical protein